MKFLDKKCNFCYRPKNQLERLLPGFQRGEEQWHTLGGTPTRVVISGSSSFPVISLVRGGAPPKTYCWWRVDSIYLGFRRSYQGQPTSKSSFVARNLQSTRWARNKTSMACGMLLQNKGGTRLVRFLLKVGTYTQKRIKVETLNATPNSGTLSRTGPTSRSRGHGSCLS